MCFGVKPGVFDAIPSDAFAPLTRPRMHLPPFRYVVAAIKPFYYKHAGLVSQVLNTRTFSNTRAIAFAPFFSAGFFFARNRFASATFSACRFFAGCRWRERALYRPSASSPSPSVNRPA